AADESIALAVAAHLGLFDEVIASDGAHNLKGAAKAERLVARFGAGGFAYIGDSSADEVVWQQAGETLRVPAPPGRVRLFLKATRVYQWVKNLLVFLPMLLGHAVLRPGVLRASLVAFLGFGLVASGSYIINDLLDLDSDRAHPRKRRRPFASGDLPLSWG